MLADPYPLWVDALAGVLRKANLDVVGTTSAASQLLPLLGTRRPDLLVTELEFQDGELDGAKYLALARARYPELRAIVLSRRSDPAAVAAALSAGAVAYVVKTIRPEDLASAIRLAFEHSAVFPALPAPQPAAEPPAPSLAPAAAVTRAGLTKREVEILKLVGEGLSNVQLAQTIWVSEQTVKFHLSNIYRKLDVSNRTEASRWAQLNGLLPESTSAVA